MVEVNGTIEPIAARPGTYAVVERAWLPGDQIVLTLPMEARLVEAHPKVDEARNQVAVMRGPVVYCLESVDLPAGVDIGEIRIPSDARLAPRHDATLLGGVTVLEGRACRVRKGDWSGVLYRDLDTTLEDVAITLIPYYAWNNRGLTQMTVWMPLC